MVVRRFNSLPWISPVVDTDLGMTGRTEARRRRTTTRWTKDSARRWTTIIVIANSSIGCWSSHVQLITPASSAPAPERLKAYRQLRPRAYRLVDIPNLDTTERYGPEPRATGEFLAALDLADGREVTDPIDLLPVVPATSDTGLALRRFEALRSTQGWAFGGLLFGVLAGLSTFVVAGQGDIPEDLRRAGLLLGSGLEVGALAMIFVLANNQDEAIAQGTRALASYEDSLRQGLALCAVGGDAVPCEELEREVPARPSLSNPPVPIATPAVDAPVATKITTASPRKAHPRLTPLVTDSSELLPLWESKRIPYAGAWSLDWHFHGLQLGFATLTQTFQPTARQTGGASTADAVGADDAGARIVSAVANPDLLAATSESDIALGDALGVTALGVTANFYVPVAGYSPELSLGLLPALHLLVRSGSTALNERESAHPSLRLPLTVVARYGTLASRFANSSLSVGAGLGLEWLVGDAQRSPATKPLPMLRLEFGIDTYQFSYEGTLGSASTAIDWFGLSWIDARLESYALSFTYLVKPWD